ncbi:hypothetical protein [Polyangium sorediatum]|uniref:GIY-YIG domain-containing protein n=1 Tax=Polyangium sorediatum TaxID=889274 RepID=A0ABT6PBJ9_9BACT|nr:hypothetical protein [Polyangium sorediatum]MDI1437510.1 hypothetical protein [Polyangium sorediatum]
MDLERPVQIVWQGPFTLAAAIASSTAPSKGVYQIYGQHIVFGPNSLLYVGMTDGQTFGARLAQHRDRWLVHEDDVTIRLGVVADLDSSARLADIEALTIWWHSPPYNSKNIWTYGGGPLRIQNLGARGRLHPEYSSHWKPARTPPDGEHP